MSNKTRIDGALRELSATRHPGQNFSASEIARACECDDQTITRIETTAVRKLAIALGDLCPRDLAEIFGQARVREIVGKCREGTFSIKAGKRGRPATADRVNRIERGRTKRGAQKFFYLEEHTGTVTTKIFSGLPALGEDRNNAGSPDKRMDLADLTNFVEEQSRKEAYAGR